MLDLAHQNINGCTITITSTPTLWSDLVNTAASTDLRNAGFDQKANGIDLRPDTGSFRMMKDGNTPTASKGLEIDNEATYQGRNISLSNLILVSTGGNITCFIQPGFCNPNETSTISSSADVTLEAGDIQIGAVEIKNATTDDRVTVDTDGNMATIDFAKLVPKIYDYIDMTYVAAGNGAGEIETVTYKTGGSGGTTQATLTLGYDSSDRLSTVTNA